MITTIQSSDKGDFSEMGLGSVDTVDIQQQAFIRSIADESARTAVNQTLITLGINPANPIEAQKDFATIREVRLLLQDREIHKDLAYVREFRSTMDTVKTKGVVTALKFIVVGAVALAVAGVMHTFNLIHFGGR